jgi:hypothetical protein
VPQGLRSNPQQVVWKSPATRRPSAASRLYVARGISLLAQDRDATCFKQGKCLGRDTQAALAAAAEDHQIRLVVQQLCHVSAENAWSVICTGFAPIPRSPAAGLKFGVAEPAEPLYFDEAPTVFDHLGRRLAHRFEASAPVSGQMRLRTRRTALWPPTTFRGSVTLDQVGA